MRWINRRPSRPLAALLAASPFVLTLIAYALGSAARRAENPNDKLLPAPSAIVESIRRLVFEADKRSGDILRMLVFAGPGVIIGGQLGPRLAHRLPRRYLRLWVGVLLLVVGGLIAYRVA